MLNQAFGAATFNKANMLQHIRNIAIFIQQILSGFFANTRYAFDTV